MVPLIIKGFLIVTVASTAINFVYLNVVDVDLKPLPILEKKLLNSGLISNKSKDLNTKKEKNSNTTNKKEKIPKEQQQQKQQKQQSETKEEIKEKLRTRLEESIFPLQKNILNLIIKNKMKNENTQNTTINLNKNILETNKTNDEVFSSLKQNIKELIEAKKKLITSKENYTLATYNLFKKFSLSGEWNKYFRISSENSRKDNIIHNYEISLSQNISSNLFQNKENNQEWQNKILGFYFFKNQNNKQKILDLGTKIEMTKDIKNWEKVEDFDAEKEIGVKTTDFWYLNSIWKSPQCNVSERKKMISSNKYGNFLYKCEDWEVKNNFLRVDALFEKNLGNNLQEEELEKTKTKINKLWEILVIDKLNFYSTIKKINISNLTHRMNKKEISELIFFNSKNIEEKENIIEYFANSWNEKNFLKIIEFK